MSAHAGGEVLRASVVHVRQVEPLRALREERVCGRSARAAAADLHDALERCSRQACRETVAVPHPVRVVPDETVIVEHHEIHGSQVRGIRVELIDEVEDELLAGVGDVHRGEAGRLGFGEYRTDVPGRPAELDEVQDAVLVVESHLRWPLLHASPASGMP